MFIWDIEKQKRIKSGYSYTNLKSILKKEGDLQILYKDTLIDFEYKTFHQKGLKSFSLLQTKEKDERTNFNNLSIKVYNKEYKSVLDYLSKSDKFTGKELVTLYELISKKLHCNMLYLTDSASVLCEVSGISDQTNLALYLLLKQNKTYYEKLGYTLDIKYNTNTYFQVNKSPQETLNYVLDRLNKIDVKEINKMNSIILKNIKKCILQNSEWRFLDIQNDGWDSIIGNHSYDYYNYFLTYTNYFMLLNNRKKLIPALLEVYDKNCILYNKIISRITTQYDYKFEFNSKIYVCEYMLLLKLLKDISSNQNNTYYYKKI